MPKCKASNKLKLGIERVNICRHFGKGECKDEDRIMIEHSAGFLDRGVHRKAYSFNTLKNPKCVVKISRDFGRNGANISEIESWKKLPSKSKKYFVGIDDFNKYGDFITQPKMTTLRSLGYNSDDRVVERFKDKMIDEGIICEDLHASNLAVKDGEKAVTSSKIKILDYGFGVSCMIGGKEKSLSNLYSIESKREERSGRKSSSSVNRNIQQLFSMLENPIPTE